MKRNCIFVLILATAPLLMAATAKWSAKKGALEVTDLDDDDMFMALVDPNGTPSSGLVGREEALADWAGSTNITTLGTVATGTINHEAGGLEADVSAYAGLVSITGGATAQVDELSELLSALTDVTAFITDDDVPAAAADPDVDAAGEIGRDTDDHSLRGYDGSAQFVYGQKDKVINVTVATPLDLDEADNLKLWVNRTGFTFNLTYIYARSDTDDVDFTLVEITDLTDYTATTTIEAVTISTNGTSVYYTSVASGDIDHTAIETGHGIFFNNDATDDPDSIEIELVGYLDGDVN